MKPTPLIATLFSIPIFLLGLSSSAVADEKTNQAVEAARSWLQLVDAKKYRESWTEAAPFFQEKVKEVDWVKMVSSVRDPLGETKSRELIGAQYTTALPGAPQGEYVVMQFQTAFQNKPEAVETVTPMKDDKGTWRVSGYYIK